MSDGTWVPRKSERLRITLHARCTAPDDGTESPAGDDSGGAGQGRTVTLVNFSAGGCCMVTEGTRLAPGTAVRLRLGSGETLTGLVRWFDGEKAGVAFDHALAPARVEYLRREHSTFLAETDWTQTRVERPVC
ncbi:MAG: PilZ domain-containing protein [Alphaproteobacteria bacterium]|nr:PilZ domain-containing protein [Alphaproteobacteria bacterium]